MLLLVATGDFETPYGVYVRGDSIIDEIEITYIRGSENFRRVVVVSDTVVPSPPPIPSTSPLAALLIELQILQNRIAVLEALLAASPPTPPPGPPVPPPPPPVITGEVLIDGDGTALVEIDGETIAR